MGAIKGAAVSVSSGAGMGAPPGVKIMGISVERGVWVAAGVHWVRLATKVSMTAAIFAWVADEGCP